MTIHSNDHPYSQNLSNKLIETILENDTALNNPSFRGDAQNYQRKANVINENIAGGTYTQGQLTQGLQQFNQNE